MNMPINHEDRRYPHRLIPSEKITRSSNWNKNGCLLFEWLVRIDRKWEEKEHKGLVRIVEKKVYIDEPLSCSLIAHISGAAVIIDKGNGLLVGQRDNVELAAHFIKQVDSYQDQYDWFHEWYDDPNNDIRKMGLSTAFDRGAEFRKQRNALHRVQHYVCIKNPNFRDWDARGPTEVVLKPTDLHGRMLGGIVWNYDAYTTPDGLEFLGFEEVEDQHYRTGTVWMPQTYLKARAVEKALLDLSWERNQKLMAENNGKR